MKNQTYSGCWANLPTGQQVLSTISIKSEDSMSPKYCVNYCWNQQYTYAGIQNGFVLNLLFFYWQLNKINQNKKVTHATAEIL